MRSLESSGALRARRRPVNGRTRVYYSVTAKGRRRLDRLSSDWERISGGVEAALAEPGRA